MEVGPERRAATTLRRMAAAAVALFVTVLAIAGAVGVGPGAAISEADTQRAGAGADGKTTTTSDSGDGLSAGPESAADGRSAGSPPEGGRAGGGTSGWSGDWLTVERPVIPGTDPAKVDPADSLALPGGSGSGRRVVFDVSRQRVWLVGRDNSAQRTYLVSGSRYKNLLKPGRYHVYSMSRHAVSYDQKETMNYMVRFAHGQQSAIGFHDVPAYSDGTLAQSRDQLGTPLSAGCIRQWITDARALWEFADEGTPVVVTA